MDNYFTQVLVYGRLRGFDMVSQVRWILLSASIAIMLLSGTLPAQADGDREPLGRVMTHWPIETRGPTQIQADTGAIRIQPTVMDGLRLRAETVTVEYQWERGYEARGDTPLGRIVTERDHETLTFHQADVRFDRFDGNGLFLAFTEEDTANLSLASEDGFTVVGTEDHTVVQIGMRPGSVEAGDASQPGFWHQISEPTLHATGPGNVHIDGSFTLFVHDVVIHLKAAGDEWSRWTGYQEGQSGPFTEFEFRLTRIHVANGTLVTSTEERADMFAPSMATDLQGTAIVPGAVGRLLQGQKILVFDDDRLSLAGSGSITMQADAPTATDPVAMWLHPQGDLEASGASIVETIPANPTPFRIPVVLAALTGLMSVALTTAGLARAGVLPVPTEASRGRRYQRWMSQGRQSYVDGRMDHASDCFRKAAMTKRQDPLAWFHWVRATLESGDMEAAETIAQQAAQVPGMDLLDLLDLRASAAWQRGDKEAFGRFLSELAKGSPEMAWKFVSDFEIQEEQMSPDLRKALKTSGPEDLLDGYA